LTGRSWKKHARCFGASIGLDYDSFDYAIANARDKIKGRIKSMKGTTVTWFGNTYDSFETSKKD